MSWSATCPATTPPGCTPNSTSPNPMALLEVDAIQRLQSDAMVVTARERVREGGAHDDGLVWRWYGSARMACDGLVLARPAGADRVAGHAVAARRQRRNDPPSRPVAAGDSRPPACQR